MDQIMSLIGCALSVFAMLALPSLGIHIIRLGWKKLIGKPWSRWYIRGAVDIAIIGVLILIVESFADSRCQVLDAVLHWVRNRETSWSYAFDHLDRLLALNFFLEHFVQFVLLPAIVMLLVGYCIERRKAARKDAKNAG